MIDAIFRAKAPLRISFCGGGTDVSPYPEERGGVVLSATIDKYAYASLRPIETKIVRVTSLDFAITQDHPLGRAIGLGSELDLISGVVNHFQFREGADPFPSGCEIFLHSDAPPGSGLGSSSTMVTTLVGVIAEWLRIPLTQYEIAERTFRIERRELRLAGGRQDQYAATFGGFNFIEFYADHTVVNPLKLRRDILCELEYSLLLCYTGRTRLSAHIVENQMQSYRQGNQEVSRALDEMKRIAIEMKALLLRDRITEFGERLHEAWLHKRNLDPAVSTPEIDQMYDTARAHGAIGGKILGAGGGGYLLVQAPFDRKHHVAKALQALGGEVVPFAFEERGLQTWIARG
jgi:D-glycero-alpha-D-manno-heptose-7-phosphate kinase